jgi:hypothetical protein
MNGELNSVAIDVYPNKAFGWKGPNLKFFATENLFDATKESIYSRREAGLTRFMEVQGICKSA